ncbi:MAG: YggS family pyridoxal phosphate-dependent enzyme [Clostridiales bacterium]|nr:YggS family pyridoxal phosphate-dependent enzyme [Clostridiales bacterium]
MPLDGEAALARLKAFREELAAWARAVGRAPEEIRLLLASKTVPADVLRAVAAREPLLLGENFAQELKVKAPKLADLPVEWHFIGHLQSNKVKDVLPFVTMIHSLDRPSLARELHKRLTKEGRRLPVLVEVNTSEEPQKHGLPPDEVDAFLTFLRDYPTLSVQGFMTVGPLTSDEDRIRRSFARLRELRDAMQARFPQLPLVHLSMGMSGDWKLAVAEGATILRIGTAIFGPRPT